MTDQAPGLEHRTIAVLGGTGPQGRGLSRRFAAGGLRVVLGSRSEDRAVATAVPCGGHRELLAGLASSLAGKVVVDCVNPLGFDKQGADALPVEEGSATEQAAAMTANLIRINRRHRAHSGLRVTDI